MTTDGAKVIRALLEARGQWVSSWRLRQALGKDSRRQVWLVVERLRREFGEHAIEGHSGKGYRLDPKADLERPQHFPCNWCGGPVKDHWHDGAGAPRKYCAEHRARQFSQRYWYERKVGKRT